MEREEVIGGWRRRHSGHNLYSSTDVVGVQTKEHEMGWAE